ncbi:MAG: type transport system permease protein [Solirubrobacteraceae bacterium]|nr:type transport system permease protein [Solirubrobacteraceae bacterium]
MSAGAGPQISQTRAQVTAFKAMCERDLWVIVRHDLAGFLAQSLLQPLFYLFIFGRVLPDIGAARGSYGTQLLPGILGLTLFLTSLQNTALPLVIDFSFTKEIEDRLLAPLSAWALGVQKMVMASLRGIVAALAIIPLAALILPGGIDFADVSWPGFLLLLLVGPLAGASVGLLLGTAVAPQKISTMFAVTLTPLLFTGATFYPWQALDHLRWFQVITLANPLTYLSEGLRASLTTVPALGTAWVALGLVVATATFGALGLRGFARRATD